jgi:hypothetical protein
MTRADGSTPAAAYVQALTNGATPHDAYQATYQGNKTTKDETK